MFIERLMNQDGAPVLESLVRFTSSRHRLLAENMVNATTPGYRQKDLSVRGFQAMLRERIEQRQDAPPGEVRFDDFELDVEHPTGGILFHDGNNHGSVVSGPWSVVGSVVLWSVAGTLLYHGPMDQ